MRSALSILLPAAFIVGLATPSSMGSVIAYDSFNTYTVGAGLNDANNGTGWTGRWIAQTSATVQGVSLSYSAGNVTVNGGGKAVQLQGQNDRMAARPFASQTGTVYFSFLFSSPTSAGLAGGDDHFQIWTRTDANWSSQNNASVVHRLNTGPNPDVTQFAARINQTGSHNFGGPATEANTTYLVVAKVTKSATNYNRVDVYVNPTNRLSEPSGSSASYVSTSALTSLGAIGLRTALWETGDTVYIDELRVGTTWQDVVVPEPATLVLLGLGAAAIVLRRRR